MTHITIFSLLLMLAACGKTGDLYLPGQPAESAPQGAATPSTPVATD